MTLADLLLAVVLTLRPARVAADVPARHAFAQSAAAAAVAEDGAPFTGDDRVTKAAAALAAIGFHESGFNADVATCKRRGALGEIASYQLLGAWALDGHSTAAVCADPVLAGRLALRVLGRHGRGDSRRAWTGYAGARLAGEVRCKTFVKVAAKLGVRARCGGAL